jgi:hypothetical protein
MTIRLAFRQDRDRQPGAAAPAPLPGTPWAVRPAAGPGARAALEIHEAGAVLDVMVDTPVASRVLRGARRARQGRSRQSRQGRSRQGRSRRGGRGRPHQAIAWGRLARGDAAVTVTFARGRLRPRVASADFAFLTAWCWIAVAEGSYDRVTVSYAGRRERLVLRRSRPW